MRSRISWLVLATTSAIVVAFVIPLCLLVRTLAADRAMNAADQAARNVALVVSTSTDVAGLEGYLTDLNGSSVPQVAVLTPGGRSLGTRGRPAPGPRRTPCARGGGGADGGRTRGRGRDPGDGRARDGGGTRAGHAGGAARGRCARVDRHRLPGVGPPSGWASSSPGSSGRRISEPLRDVAHTAHQLREGDLSATSRGTGHARDRGAGPSAERSGRAHHGAPRRGAGRSRRPVAPAADAGHRAAAGRRVRDRPEPVAAAPGPHHRRCS